jgi:antitoxin MazE
MVGMQVTKVGDQLTVPIPDDVVKELGLKEGDEVGVYLAKPRDVGPDPEKRREEALRILRSLARPFPPDFKFNREEANER